MPLLLLLLLPPLPPVMVSTPLVEEESSASPSSLSLSACPESDVVVASPPGETMHAEAHARDVTRNSSFGVRIMG